MRGMLTVTTRYIATLGVCLLATVVLVRGQVGERVVPVHQEPRHRMVLEAGTTRIFHLQIHPGDVTLWHTHAEPVFYVGFNASETRAQTAGAPWSAPVLTFPKSGSLLSSVAYAKQSLTHRIENVGSNLFELIGVLNTSRGDASRTPEAVGFQGTPELSNDWFRAYRLSVAAGETVKHTHGAPVVIAQISSGIGLASGRRNYGLNAPTSWGYFDAHEAHQLRNISVLVSGDRDSATEVTCPPNPLHG